MICGRHPKSSKSGVAGGPVPGIPPWDELTRDPRSRHWTFYNVPDLPEVLIAGREQFILFRPLFADRGEHGRAGRGSQRGDTRLFRTGALRWAWPCFRAFAENARQNAGYGDHKSPNAVLALGGASGNGMVRLAVIMRNRRRRHRELRTLDPDRQRRGGADTKADCILSGEGSPLHAK